MTHTLVVGGTRGIGRAVMRAFAAGGNRVTVLGRSPSPEVDRAITGVVHRTIDVCDADGVVAMCADLPTVDNVVFLQRGRGHADDWSGELETSLTATRRIIELLAARQDSPRSFVVVSSIAADCVAHNQPASYHVGKAGLNQLVRYCAVALGGRGIRVNGVAPATTLKEESRDFFDGNAELRDLYARMIPLRRMGTAEDVANVVDFLCSDKASFVTGQVIVVDGGMTLQCPETLVRQIIGI